MLINDVLTIVVKLNMPILFPFLLLMMVLLMSQSIIDVIYNAVGSRRSK